LCGHFNVTDERKFSNMLPIAYKLLAKKRMPNLELISAAGVFELLPARVWLIMNDLLGVIRKGYWVILRFIKP